MTFRSFRYFAKKYEMTTTRDSGSSEVDGREEPADSGVIVVGRA
jgi:hypothetical protein